MPEAQISVIDDLCWTSTKFSDVLKIDRRVCQQALETAPYRMMGKRQVWHVRDGMPAIFRRVHGVEGAGEQVNPAKLPPKDRLDHYKAERERIKLAQEVRVLIPAAEMEQVIGEAFKTIAQTLDVLPETFERDFALPPEAVIRFRSAIDSARDALYESTSQLTVAPDGLEDA
jgi:hypothetical protein